MKGRKRTPTATLEARGSRRIGNRRGEPRLPVKAPSCPSWLSAEAKAEWRRVCRQLVAMGIAAEADRAALAIYCDAWAEFHSLVKEIRDARAAGHGGELVARAARRKEAAAAQLLKAAVQFGLTPSARASVKADPPPAEADPFEEEFIRGVVG